MKSEVLLMLAAGVLLLVSLAMLMVLGTLGRQWLKAFTAGAPTTLFTLVGMLLRGTPRSLIVDAYIQLTHRGCPASIQEVESLYLANRQRVRQASDLVDIVERHVAAAVD